MTTTRTLNGYPGEPAAQQARPPEAALVDPGRVVPLLDVRLPEIRALAARGEGLVVRALARDAQVVRETVGEHRGHLRREEDERRVCDVMGSVADCGRGGGAYTSGGPRGRGTQRLSRSRAPSRAMSCERFSAGRELCTANVWGALHEEQLDECPLDSEGHRALYSTRPPSASISSFDSMEDVPKRVRCPVPSRIHACTSSMPGHTGFCP